MTFEAGLRFLQHCPAQEDVAALVQEFVVAAAWLGLESGAAGAWTGIGRTRAYRFYFNTWPADWMALYNERQIFFDDPIVLESQRRIAPFLWRDLEQHRSLTDRGMEVLKLAYDYGWADGLVIPVHGPAGYQGVVSLASMRRIEISPANMSLLWAMSLALHARCREAPELGVRSSPPPRLTAREIDCMRWIAAGKTEWETAQLLAIAQPTVHFHIERVKRRLATSSRTEAVALLVLHGVL